MALLKTVPNFREVRCHCKKPFERSQIRLLRSAAPIFCDVNDANSLLSEYSLGVVVDLRGNAELASDGPVVDFLQRTVAVHSLPLHVEASDSTAIFSSRWRLRLCIEARYHVSRILKLIEQSSEKNVSVLICCSAGKDRTGLMVALLLRALGQPVEWIADDYATSYTGESCDPEILRRYGFRAKLTDAEWMLRRTPPRSHVREIFARSPFRSQAEVLSWLQA